jgi:hypothetical protein
MATSYLARCNFLVWSTKPHNRDFLGGISCGHGCGRAWGSLFEQGRVPAHCAVWPHCIWSVAISSSGPQAPQPQGFLVVMVAAELGGRCLSKAVSQHTVRYGHIASGPLQFPRLVHKPHNPRDFLWSWLRQSLGSLFEQGRVSAHCAVWPRRIWLVAISSSGPQAPQPQGFLVVMVAAELERRCLSKAVSQHTVRYGHVVSGSLQFPRLVHKAPQPRFSWWDFLWSWLRQSLGVAV